MEAISKLLIYIPGIILFLVGSRQAGEWLSSTFWGSRITAKVISANHVLKKDERGREVYNYYNILAEYTNPANSHVQRSEIKSLFPLAKGQSIKLVLDKKGEDPKIAENFQGENLHPLVLTMIGAILILLAMELNRGHEVASAVYFGIAFLIGGINMVVHQYSLKKKGLQLISGKIIDIYNRQISKETKILKGEKYTNYPIVSFEVNGQEVIFRPEVNSSNEKDFHVDDEFRLYYDVEDEEIYEKSFSIGYTIVGAVLAILGAVILASAVSVIL